MIFGIGSPRFIYNHTLPGEVTVDLDNAKILDFTPETEYVEQVSLIDGQTERFSRGASWTVRILIHLFKYTDPTAIYQTIAGYIGKNVTLYMHRDGLPFLGSLMGDCLFTLKEVAPFFLTTTDFKDVAILTFENVEVSNALPTPGRYVSVPWYDANGDPMYDANHDQIYVQVLV